jgi:phosphinothricin acetyltransferase
MIRPATVSDARAIVGIYNHYIANTVVTFETELLPVEEMERRITEISASYLYYVAEENGKVLGYAYANKWQVRAAYRFSVESTVYLDPAQTGRGLGSQLYMVLLDELRARSFHAVIGGIALPNEASVAIHEKFGFKKVAHYPQVGWKFDRWIDVGYWELLL